MIMRWLEHMTKIVFADSSCSYHKYARKDGRITLVLPLIQVCEEGQAIPQMSATCCAPRPRTRPCLSISTTLAR